MNNTTIGSSQKALTIANLKGLKIPLPPIATQQKIADILSAYDDLIENNRKQIKLLEEAAQRLYKKWFVDLRFPGHEHTLITDGIPEGWKKIPLSEVAPILTGKKDANYGTPDGTYPFFTCAQEPIKAPGFSFDKHWVLKNYAKNTSLTPISIIDESNDHLQKIDANATIITKDVFAEYVSAHPEQFNFKNFTKIYDVICSIISNG